MTSVDTNILLYALNSSAPENTAARAFLDAHKDDSDFVISELVLVELYVLLRNAAVITRPLSAQDASAIVQRFRRHPRWQLIDHLSAVMDDVWKAVGRRGFARHRIFDVRLALGLRQHGVSELATRNTRHFEGLGFERLWDPLSA